MKNTGSPPSRFWARLLEALKEQGLPTSQRGIARMLGMSQGSIGRWYHGESLPQLATARRLAIKGKVTVDWLITGRKPKYPISADPTLNRIMEICIDLDLPGREAVLRVARREKAQKERGGNA
jgi:transcriptional regulator with XRE-family HTH domain